MGQRRHYRFPGVYRGIVVQALENGRGELILKVPGVYGADGISPPAMAAMGGGVAGNFGECWIPPEGSSVWVMFQYGGNPASPVWFPGWVAASESASDLGDAFQGKDDIGEAPPRGTDIAEDADENKYYEPEPRSLGEYPHVRGWRSESGHLIIMDDTAGDELMQLTHKDGAMIEWSEGGSELHRVPGEQYEVVYGGSTKHYQSDVVEVYDGSVNKTIHGDYDEHVVGNRKIGRSGAIEHTHDGDLSETVQGAYEKTLGNDTRKVKNSRQLVVGGANQRSDRYQTETHQESRSSFTVGDATDPTKDVHVNQVMFGNILNQVATQGNIKSITLLGDVELSTTAGNAKLNTVAGTASLETAAGEAKVEGTQANLIGTANCGVDAPFTIVGTGASVITAPITSNGVAKIGSKSTGFATLGPINLPVQAFVESSLSTTLYVLS